MVSDGGVGLCKDCIRGSMLAVRFDGLIRRRGMQDVLDEKGPTVAAFRRAIDRAEQPIVSDSAEVARLFALYEEAMDPATLEALIPIIQAQVASSAWW